MSSSEKALQPLIAKLYVSETEDELIGNFKELKALLTSILEADEIESDSIITVFHALIEMAKMQSVSIMAMKSKILELERNIQK